MGASPVSGEYLNFFSDPEQDCPLKNNYQISKAGHIASVKVVEPFELKEELSKTQSKYIEQITQSSPRMQEPPQITKDAHTQKALDCCETRVTKNSPGGNKSDSGSIALLSEALDCFAEALGLLADGSSCRWIFLQELWFFLLKPRSSCRSFGSTVLAEAVDLLYWQKLWLLGEALDLLAETLDLLEKLRISLQKRWIILQKPWIFWQKTWIFLQNTWIFLQKTWIL